MLKQFKIPVLAGLGGMLEFYDFILYMIFAPQITQTFFSGIANPYVQSMLVIATFSVAYLVRPIGGILVGWMGDTLGRKRSFSLTILVMAFAVLLMGLMPSYQAIGLAAPILFICLRVIQGLAVAGELPGAMVFVYESISHKRGLALGVMFCMVYAAFLLGDFAKVTFGHFFGDYAWRVAFLSGSVIAFIGFYIRIKLSETPLFTTLENKQKFPLIHLLISQPTALIAGILCVVMIAYNGTIIGLYMPFYIKSHIAPNFSYEPILMLCALLNICIVAIGGWLTDKASAIKLYCLVACIFLISAYPIFMLINSPIYSNFIIGMIFITALPSLATGIFLPILCGSFSTNVRYSGVAISYNIAFAVIGGAFPLLIEHLIHLSNPTIGASVLAIIVGLISLVAVALISLNPKKQTIY